MIAVIGGIKTLVRVKLTPPERDLEKQKKQDEEALLAAGIDLNKSAEAMGAESPEDARFRHYYESKMREQEAENYWSEVGLGVKDFGGYPPIDANETDIRTFSSGCAYTVAKLLGEKAKAKSLEDMHNEASEVAFVSMVGNDTLGLAAKTELKGAGVDITSVKTIEGCTPVSIEILNVIGDLEFCRENNSLTDNITPQYIDECAEVLDKAASIFVDGSIPIETLDYISEKYSGSCKIFFDPSSIQGGVKFAESKFKCSCVMPGRMEAEAMTGLQVLGIDQLMAAGNALEERGVKSIIVTLKGGGLYYKEGTNAGIIKPEKVISFADTNGAGDVLSAEMVYRLTQGAELTEAAQYAMNETAEYLKGAERSR